jgi:hypothetical protein
MPKLLSRSKDNRFSKREAFTEAKTSPTPTMKTFLEKYRSVVSMLLRLAVAIELLEGMLIYLPAIVNSNVLSIDFSAIVSFPSPPSIVSIAVECSTILDLDR